MYNQAEASEELRKHHSGFFEMQQPVESIAEDTVIKNSYRCESNSSTDDEDSTTSDSSSSDSNFFQEMCERSKPKKLPFVKTKGELGLDDLPPIEDLVISVNEEEMCVVGKIYAVVEKLVVVRALKGMKALDLDSVLFLSHEQPLGRVFDVFGPIKEPFYSVRFNTTDKINMTGVRIDAEVFFAPEKSDITSYVFVEKLQNQKGSDASWKDNNEPPEEFLDFSDDEKEKSARQQRRLKSRNQKFNSSGAHAAKRPLLSDDSSNRSRPSPQCVSPSNATPWTIHSSQRPIGSYSDDSTNRCRPSPQCVSPSNATPWTIHSSQRPIGSYSDDSSNCFRPPPQCICPSNATPWTHNSQRPFGSYTSGLISGGLISPYQQPHVFGQVSFPSHLSPALAPSPLPSPEMNILGLQHTFFH